MIKEYLTYIKKVRNLSDNTVRAYRKDLQDFTRWARPEGLTWSTLKKQDIDRYNAHLGEQEKAATTRCRRISAIRNMLRWAMHEGILKENAAQWCQSPKLEETLPKGIDPNTLTQYLERPATTDRARTIHALVALMLDTGCRLQEAIDIRCEDVNVTERSITIHGKGKKERKVYFTDRTIMHCVATANKRKGYLIDKHNQWEIRDMMHKELPTVHPHMIRHTMATTMLNNGASLDVISQLLGHTSRKTTERYARVSTKTTQRQFEQYHA